MKKLFLAAAAILIVSGITSCKKGQDETKNETQQTETTTATMPAQQQLPTAMRTQQWATRQV